MSRIESALEKAALLKEKREKLNVEQDEIQEINVQDMLDTFKNVEPLGINNPFLVTANDPNSPIAEEYRKLKSLVVRLTKTQDAFQNTLMVTSTVGGEGKSLTSLNLAISLAQEFDHTVLLVDADLRQPSIGDYLGIKAEIGLADCLLNDIDVGKALIKTGIGKLVYLPSGHSVPNPVELLSSNRMKAIIHELKSRYKERYVIIDTPPILPFAEAHSIGTYVDGVIFVVKEGQVPVNDLKDALRMLNGANLLGIVFNAVETESHHSHYYYYRSNYKNKG